MVMAETTIKEPLTTEEPIKDRIERPIDNMIIKFLSLFDSSSSNSLRRQLKGLRKASSGLPLFYGVSFATALALLTGMDKKPLSRLFASGADQHRDTYDDHLASGSSNVAYAAQSAGYSGQPYIAADPVVQKFLTTKDGQAHYHHIFHYHVPYPMAMAKPSGQSPFKMAPQLPWYSPEAENNYQGTPMILSSYSGNSLSPKTKRRQGTNIFGMPQNYPYTPVDREDDTNQDGANDEAQENYPTAANTFLKKSNRPVNKSVV
ncbi:hypothetical protein HDE_01765 [Halotydeus destructor]|nr:hypothetical protein HDE_01765 [Halotydeus destructor]